MNDLEMNQANWGEVREFLSNVTLPFQYGKTFRHKDKNITLTLDIDPGGGFESGYELTSLSAPVPIQFTSISTPLNTSELAFRFALHDESVMDRIGKFFGSQDVEIGYEEFDKQLIVKTNDAEKLRNVFSSLEARKVFRELKDFSLEIVYHENENPAYTLEFLMDRAITDTDELQKIFEAYTIVLDNI